MLNSTIKWSFLPLLLVAIIPTGQRVDGGQASDGGPKLAANWWSISDSDFVTQYGKLAIGTQEQQSRFAWMAFARSINKFLSVKPSRNSRNGNFGQVIRILSRQTCRDLRQRKRFVPVHT